MLVILCLLRSALQVTSQNKDSSGTPLVELSEGTLKVRSLEEVANVLKMSQEKSLNEARLCLEGKRYSTHVCFLTAIIF